MLQGNVSEIEETARLMRFLSESIKDHGGTVESLNRLLVGDRGDRELLARIAKLLVGKIWDHVEKPRPLPLTTSDFESPVEKFLAKYPQVVVNGRFGLSVTSVWNSEMVVPSVAGYRLRHFERPMLFHEILEAISTEQQAGWRELFAYVALLSPEDFSGCEIIAPGARTFRHTHAHQLAPMVEGTGFLTSWFARGELGVAWHTVSHPEREKFSTKCFYLVREY